MSMSSFVPHREDLDRWRASMLRLSRNPWQGLVRPTGRDVRGDRKVCSPESHPPGFSERSPPSQPAEAGVIPIRGDPFASEFNCECREPRILSDISIGLGFLTKGFKYFPMPITGNNDRRVELLQQCTAECEDIIQ